LNILTPAEQWAKKAPETKPEQPHHEEPDVTGTQRLAVFLGVVVPFLGLLAAIVHWWGRGIGWLEISLLVGGYMLTVLGITGGFHRLFTHKSFEASQPVRILLAILGSMSLQGPVIRWCAVHRRHHQCSDDEGDPHSPHGHGTGVVAMIKGAWHAHVGWIFQPDKPDLARSVKDLTADKALLFIDRTFLLWVALGLLIPAVIGWAVTGSGWGFLSGLLWGGLVRICVMHHATWCINSVCHIWGARPYNSGDHSRNNPIFGIVSLGEGWHNNHHAFPTSARHGLRWWQFDFTWVVIKALSLVGLAWNVRVPNEQALKAKERKAQAAKAAEAQANAGTSPVAGLADFVAERGTQG
jgi:stearoyl-CoA desaturase (delta-9 desaturase)